MSNEPKVFYFGCWGRAGHYMWGQGGKWVQDYEARKLKLPTAGQLDATTLFLPQEVIGQGAVTYLPGPNLTVLAWWGNSPFDERGKVNNAIITIGDTGEDGAWKLFARYFPELEKLLKRPQINEGPAHKERILECAGHGPA